MENISTDDFVNEFIAATMDFFKDKKIYVHSPLNNKIYFYNIVEGNKYINLIPVDIIYDVVSTDILNIILWNLEYFD